MLRAHKIALNPNKRGLYTIVPKTAWQGRISEWLEQIPDTPENVARAILTTAPKKDDEWEYMKRHKKKWIWKCK